MIRAGVIRAGDVLVAVPQTSYQLNYGSVEAQLLNAVCQVAYGSPS